MRKTVLGVLFGLLSVAMIIGQENVEFKMTSFRGYSLRDTRSDQLIQIRNITLDKLNTIFGKAPQKNNGKYEYWFESTINPPYFIISEGFLQWRALDYIALEGSCINGKIYTGMTIEEVKKALGEPSSTRQGALKYYMWDKVSANFRLGFEENGKLFEIRM